MIKHGMGGQDNSLQEVSVCGHLASVLVDDYVRLGANVSWTVNICIARCTMSVYLAVFRMR